MPTKTQNKKPLKKTVIIKKSRWSRFGTSKGCRDTEKLTSNFQQSLQCEYDNKRCCLGFICVQAMSFKPSEILGCGLVPNHDKGSLRLKKWYNVRSAKAASINDDEDTSDAVKIRLLKKLFDKSPIRLKFIP